MTTEPSKKLESLLAKREKMKADFKIKLRDISLSIGAERKRIGYIRPSELKRRQLRAEKRAAEKRK